MPTSLMHDRYKSGEGYHAVPPPYTGTFMPPKPDLIFYDALITNDTIPTVLTVEPSSTKPYKDFSQSNRPSAPIIKDWVFDSKDESEGEPMPTQKAPSFVQTSEHIKTPRPSVKPVEHPILAKNLRKDILKSRGHRHSWNRKSCFVCKSLTYLIKDCDYYEKKMVHKPVRNHAMRVLTRSRLVPLTAATPITTTVPQTKVQHQRPTKHGVNKTHSPIIRPINLRPSPQNNNFHQKVTTVKAIQVNAIKGIKENWGNPQHALKDKGVIDSGCSRHMTGNISYLSDFEEINRGYVAFGGNQKRWVAKENNMYNVDLKNIVPSGDLTCLFPKATLDKGLPSKVFENNHTCVACKNGKQHRAFWRGPTWLFDIDTLTQSMNYQPVVSGNQPNFSADPQNTDVDATFEVKELESKVHVSLSSSAKTKKHDDKTKREAKGKSPVELSTGVRNLSEEFEDFSSNSTNEANDASTPVTAVEPNSTNSTNTFTAAGPSKNPVSLAFEFGGKSSFVDPSKYPDDPYMPALEDITYSDDEEDVGAEADFSNLETNITVSPIPTTRVHKDHHVTQIIGDLSLAPQTRSMTRMVKEQDLHKGKRAIGSKWIFRNKKDERGIVIRNKARLVTQGHTQEEGVDYEEVFSPVARIEAIRLFLAYASFMGFMVYQMDVKSAFLYGTIKEEVYVYQPPRIEVLDYLYKVYKVVKALYGLHQEPRAWYETLANYLLKNGFQMGKIDQTSFIKKQKGDILPVQEYVDDIIFRSTNKDLCKAFEKLMKDKFQMSSMGELTFFLGF
nr:putative ribonuclease H-like domain-containing protein [Tanacetum cinerariifolium]